MYKVRFNTAGFQNKNRRGWERQLMNDFAVAINGKEFECETDLDLKNRLSFIAGYGYSSENKDQSKVWDEYEHNENNYFDLTSKKYNTQRLRYGMYGIAQGYISIDNILEQVKKKGYYKILFKNFYDIRQGNFFKGCFVEITKNN